MALTATVTPGKTLVSGESATNSKLNQGFAPVVTLSGTADTADISTNAVTAAKAAYGPWFYCTDAGTANAHSLTAVANGTTLPTVLVAGQQFNYAVAVNNTGAVTVAISGIAGTKAMTKYGANPMSAGDLRAGQIVSLRYDGTGLQLQTMLGQTLVISGVDAGSTSAYAITPSPSVHALVDIVGYPVTFKAATINTGAASLTLFGLALTPIVKSYNGVLDASDIKAGQWVTVVYDGANFQLQSPVTVASARATVPVRQTVLSGPVDATTALPVLLTITGSSLAVTLKASSGSPLVMAFANGFDTSGAVDYIARITADVASAWTVPGAAGTYYLYADRNVSTGVITYGYTTIGLIPRYADDSPGSAAVIVTNQHTFLINEMRMYLGNGATAAVVQRVFLGHAVTSAGIVSSVVSYVFRGRFKSGADIPFGLDNNAKTETHQLGLTPFQFRWVLVNLSGGDGHTSGGEVDMPPAFGSSGVSVDMFCSAATLTVRYLWATYPPYVLDATPALNIVDATQWKLRAYAWRGW